MKDSILAVIRGDLNISLTCVRDMNVNGLGCEIKSGKKIKQRPVILDLISKRNRIILRSLPACIVFTNETTLPKKDEKTVWRRCGIKFGNLSTLQKRQLDIIIKKYAISA
ncbi:MAG: hypothetical protein U9P36_04030 [Thermodesulfobacteriota bacterium]|nr:hypothetical protein [Thermodesulfobacteriota bacterium]